MNESGRVISNPSRLGTGIVGFGISVNGLTLLIASMAVEIALFAEEMSL